MAEMARAERLPSDEIAVPQLGSIWGEGGWRAWALGAVVFTLLSNFYLVMTAEAEVSADRLRIGSLCLWTAVPAMIAFAKARTHTLLFGPVVLIAYAIYFSRNVFGAGLHVRENLLSEPELVDAAWVLLPGLGGVAAAFWMAHVRRVNRYLPVIDWSPDIEKLRGRLAVVSILEPVVRLALSLGLVPSALSQPFLLIQRILQCAGLIVLCDIFVARRSMSWHAWLVVSSMVLSGLISVGGSLIAAPMLIFLVPMFAYVSIRRRIPVLVLLAFIAAMGPLLYVKYAYRQSHDWARYDVGSSARFLEFTYNEIESGGFDSEHLADNTKERVNMFGSLAQVVTKSPGEVPLWQGETYEPVLTAFVPRALWPEKKVLDTGQQFGHRYGFLDEDDYITSANMPQLVELRANFDTPWMFLGMFIIGYLQVILWRLFDHARSGPVLFAVGSSILTGCLMLECSFSLSIAAAFLHTPLTVVGIWLLLGADLKQLPRIVFHGP